MSEKMEQLELPFVETPVKMLPRLKESVLQEAQRLVYGERASTHGEFDDNFIRAARLVSAWTGETFTPVEIAQVLICLKMARAHQSPKNRDNYTDMAGYTELLHRMIMKGK